MSTDDVAAIVRDGYDRIADQYMAVVSRPRPADPRDTWSERLLQRLAPSSAVLDLGCGPGVPTAAVFASAGHRVVGVDISPRQIELARRNVPQSSFVVSDLTEFEVIPVMTSAEAARLAAPHLDADTGSRTAPS